MLNLRLSTLALLLAAEVYGTGNSFRIEDVMSAPFASGLVAAPSGAAAAWIENEQGRRNIWIASGPDWKAHRATNFDRDDGQEIDDLAWSPDSRYLLFARGGDFENGGENPNPDLSLRKPEQEIWRVDATGEAPLKLVIGHAPQISSTGTVVFLRGGQIYSLANVDAKSGKPDATLLLEQKGEQSGLRWSPDGTRLAFVSERAGHSFIAIYSVADKSLSYLDPSVDHDSEPAWSSDSTQLAFLRIPSQGREAFFSEHRSGPPWSIRVADVKTGKGREVFRAHNGPGSVFSGVEARQQIFWSGDGLVFPWERTGWKHLYSIALNGGQARELTPGTGEVEHVSQSADRKTFYYSTNIGDMDRRHIFRVSLNSSPQAVTSGEGIEWEPAPAADNSALVYLCSSYNQRAHAAVRLGNGQPRDLDPAGPASFPKSALVKPQPVLITAADGLQIHGQLFLPADHTEGEKHPALIFFHGGSRRQMLLGFHYMFYYSNAYSLNEYFANHGYVVLSVNYRSGIGYGLNFREAIDYGAHGASEFNDVIGAGLYLKSRADVDPGRIGVWGGSYGGYLTAMALSRASDLFAAGVDFHGVHDWSALRGYLTRTGESADPEELHDRQEAARIAFESSPMASVDTWRSPVLLIHGDDDRNVEFSQTLMLAEALRKRNVPFEQLIFPNEIHDFLLYRHWVEAYQHTADFFDRKLKPPAPEN
ncbi:MAG TPA: prolyl oligopeptidase family serine peptidase [Bryobacteraceae bacterium]|nr:prolyl oligopeptidase family serine peptidase [Bryobacteraceae bacterium]